MTPLQNKREMFEKALAQKDFETARAILEDTWGSLRIDDLEGDKELTKWEHELSSAIDKELV